MSANVSKVKNPQHGRVRVTQVHSVAGKPKNQSDTLRGLGLGRIGKSRELEANPAVMGMIRTVQHLIKYEMI